MDNTEETLTAFELRVMTRLEQLGSASLLIASNFDTVVGLILKLDSSVADTREEGLLIDQLKHIYR